MTFFIQRPLVNSLLQRFPIKLGQVNSRSNTTRAADFHCKAVVMDFWGLVASPLWSAAETWEKSKKIPVGSFRNLWRLNGGALQKVVAGTVDIESGSKELLKEMREVGLDTSHIAEASDIHECLSNILKSVRVNGDIRDTIQCLRFDGIQTCLLSQTRRRDGRSADPIKDMTDLNKEIVRHFNATFQYSDQKFKKDPQIFQEIFDKFSLQPQEVVFVDPRKEMLLPAASLGAENANKAIDLLEDELQVPLRNFAWTRDQYAKVLWVSNKDCTSAST
eukprot:756370-Hanusia_phi.AAC.6